MLRAVFVGNLTADSNRRNQFRALFSQASLFGIEPIDATIGGAGPVAGIPFFLQSMSAHVEETVRRIREVRGARPGVIVGLDPLHAAIAVHALPGVPWVVHAAGISRAASSRSMLGTARLPGLYSVLGGTMRGAWRVLGNSVHDVTRLCHQWELPGHRTVIAPLDALRACPEYVDAARYGIGSADPEMLWWLDLWQLGQPIPRGTAMPVSPAFPRRGRPSLPARVSLPALAAGPRAEAVAS